MNERKRFDQAMNTILRADPKAVKAAMEAEKKADAEMRKGKKTFRFGPRLRREGLEGRCFTLLPSDLRIG